MSLAEILDNGAPHPWANIRVQDIVADGSFTIAGGISITGDLDINGGNLNVTPGEIRTNIIQPAVPNADLIVQANGIQNFDVQTAALRSNTFFTNSIDTKTPGANLQIGGANALFIQANDNIVPDSDNARDLGSALSNFANVYSHVVRSSGAFDLQLQAATGIVDVPTGNELRSDIIRSNAGQALDLISNGPTDISLSAGSGLIQVGNSALNGNSFLLSNAANQFSPKVDNVYNLGTALLRFANLYLGTGLTLPNGGSVLDYYNSKASTATLSYSGAIAAGTTTGTVTRIGSLCTLHIPGIVGAAIANSSITITGLDAAFRPSINGLSYTYNAVDNSAVVAGVLTIDNVTGNIVLYAAAQQSFQNMGNCGMLSDIEISYIC